MAFTDFLDGLGGILDPVMRPVMEGIPSPYNLLLITFIISGLITLAYKFFTDQKLMKEIKDELKSLQKDMKESKSEPDKAMGFQKKMMENQLNMFKQSLKPMIITMIPILIVFTWLRGYYIELGNPKILFGLTWLWVYIIVSVILSLVLRKVLKIH